MPECQNCGAFVTSDYARVFTPDGIESPRVCPQCEDKIRDGADVREARSTRRS
jgi:NAD-dependent SIR2 family protein deacetylase